MLTVYSSKFLFITYLG